MAAPDDAAVLGLPAAGTPIERLAVVVDPGRFGADEVDLAAEFFRRWGFATLTGLFDEDELAALDRDMAHRQEEVVAGRLPEKHGTVILDDPDAMVDGEPFAHYVCHVTQCSTLADRAARNPVVVETVRRLLGDGMWLLDYERFGVVYQDARPGDRSGYSRIGWHSDRQSGPHLAIWPSVAFTIHLDPTSPANGFLRVVPGSHLGGTEGMPLGFEKVAGEVAVYCERGDVLLHDADLWHAAARATEDPPDGVRRHIRGSWYAGERLDEGHGLDDFVKNARR